jgi:hypothetical protein
MGTCSPVPAGQAPQTASACVKADAASCGLDGTCDGKGSCRRYPAGTVCLPGTCEQATVVGIDVCDGKGACKPGPATVCAPFGCDASTSRCFAACSDDSQCASGQKCVNGTCGAKPRGAVCAADRECASGACADGLCCDVACQGPCATCNAVGHEGTCWPTDAGNRDPRGVCTNQGPASCGQTGTCDGMGGCAKYPAETICVAPSCNGDTLSTAGTCDGLGTCRSPGVQDCDPYRCVDGACTTRCTSATSCHDGHVCTASGSCGPKQNGQACATGPECVTGVCADGVCCNVACGDPCTSCALPSSKGTCSPVSGGAPDPRGLCHDQGADSCGTDGACDGGGHCRKYPANTMCAPESCDPNLELYTGPSICDGAGACVPPAPRMCAPFACNGSRCYETCASDGQCAPPNVCNSGSCGKKLPGALCSDGSECLGDHCAQGVCCMTACNGICVSCALPTSRGTCMPVPPAGVDPTGSCSDAGAGSCGTTGLCDGTGACARYPLGSLCSPGPSCVDGVCCASASCGVCQACNVLGKEGGCAAVDPNTMDPHGRCTPAPPCGFTGACDGAGACLDVAASTACGTASCTDAMFTPVGACDGSGTCVQTTSGCGEYQCGPDGKCLTMCTMDEDCVSADTCQMGACTHP